MFCQHDNAQICAGNNDESMRQDVNILFLGGAKRVAMGRLFKEAGRKLGMDVLLFSYELSSQVPIAEEASVIVGRRWAAPDLMSDLHETVQLNNIDIIIPFVDPAVEVAAKYAAGNPGVFTPFNDSALAELMFDKMRADEIFREIGVPLPRNAMLEHVDGEVICKPRHGSASKGMRVLDASEFDAVRSRGETKDYLCQEYVAEREEYTVDCYVAMKGNVVCAVPRRRLEVAGGEVMTTVTVHDEEVERLSRKVLENLHFRGPVTIQFLRNRADGRLMLMEVNPRLGGGAVCAVHAGADIPGFILTDWRDGAVSSCDTWKSDVRICRYFQEVVFMPGSEMPVGKKR